MSFGFIKNIITMLRGKKPIQLEIIGDEYYIMKKIKHINETSDIQTLVLGSSHLETSFIAEDAEFNLATTSQDLYLSYELYKKYNSTKLKNVILSYSNFSPWAHIIRGNSANYTIYFNLFANIDFEDSNYAKKKNLYSKKFMNRIFLKKAYKNLGFEPGYRGNFQLYPEGYKEISPVLKEKIQRAENRERDCIDKYLIPLIDATEKNDQNLFFVLTPHLDEFKKLVAPKETLFKELFDAIRGKKHVHLIDLYDSEDFKQSDFYDYQHLNFSGAQKLTNIIRNKVYGENNG